MGPELSNSEKSAMINEQRQRNSRAAAWNMLKDETARPEDVKKAREYLDQQSQRYLKEQSSSKEASLNAAQGGS